MSALDRSLKLSESLALAIHRRKWAVFRRIVTHALAVLGVVLFVLAAVEWFHTTHVYHTYSNIRIANIRRPTNHICSELSITTQDNTWSSYAVLNYTQDSIHDTRTHVRQSKRVLVSYAVYISDTSLESHRLCQNNADVFVNRAVAYSQDVLFVFSIIGDSCVPISILNASERFENVMYIHQAADSADLFVHGDVFRSSRMRISLRLFGPDYFVALNCGARGPYSPYQGMYLHRFNMLRLLNDVLDNDSLSWLSVLTTKLIGDVRAIGATISCETYPHIQTYFIAFDKTASDVILTYWDRTRLNATDKGEIIHHAEVGMGRAMIRKGYTIASLDERHSGQTNEQLITSCEEERREWGVLTNPVICKESGVGCSGVDPCETLFVKYGGDVANHRHIPEATRARVLALDTSTTERRCSAVTKIIETRS